MMIVYYKFLVQVTLYEKQIKGCSNGGRKRYLEKGGNNKLLNREWRQYLKCTKRGLKVIGYVPN